MPSYGSTALLKSASAELMGVELMLRSLANRPRPSSTSMIKRLPLTVRLYVSV